jgi:hypothetical protein
MPYNITPEENERTLQNLFVVLNVKHDRKCYFPCTQCRGFNRRILLITTTEIHCRQFGHAEGAMDIVPW